MLRFSVEAGARLAGASPAASAALSAYGRALGAAFQVADDILDAEGDAGVARQTRRARTPQRNKATFVAALGLEGARRELVRLVDAARTRRSTQQELGEAGDVLRAAARL